MWTGSPGWGVQTGPGAGSQRRVAGSNRSSAGREKGVLPKGEVRGLGKLDLHLSAARLGTASKCLRTEHVF